MHRNTYQCDECARRRREGRQHVDRDAQVRYIARRVRAAHRLAGHQEMSVTQGYMHLSPDALGRRFSF